MLHWPLFSPIFRATHKFRVIKYLFFECDTIFYFFIRREVLVNQTVFHESKQSIVGKDWKCWSTRSSTVDRNKWGQRMEVLICYWSKQFIVAKLYHGSKQLIFRKDRKCWSSRPSVIERKNVWLEKIGSSNQQDRLRLIETFIVGTDWKFGLTRNQTVYYWSQQEILRKKQEVLTNESLSLIKTIDDQDREGSLSARYSIIDRNE